jgi:uncharacterized protein (TIGR03067 family)
MNRRVALALLLVCWSANARGEDVTLDAAQKVLEAMQGTWTISSFTSDGEDAAASDIVAWKRTVKDRHVVWKDGDKLLLETDIKIDASVSPMRLDSTIATGDAKGQTMLAIYELSDDTLRVCFAPPGEPRPSVLAAPKGSGLLMFTAKRLSK